MVEIEVTWDKVAKIWWSILWRYILFAGLFGGLFGFIVGFVGGIIRINKATFVSISLFGCSIIALAVSLWVLMKVFRKKNFGDFRIALIVDRVDTTAVENISPVRQFYIN
jgi:LytS/YehU family sensor histidine kinase